MLRARLTAMQWLLTFSILGAQDPVPPKPADDAWPPHNRRAALADAAAEIGGIVRRLVFEPR